MKTALYQSAFALLGAAAMVFSQLAFADATVVYEQSSGTQKSANTMQIKDGKIRFSPPGNGPNNDYSLYDSKNNELTHVDAVNKQYITMDENTIAQQANKAKQQMDKMRQEMMSRMKDMPPEQKKQMEQMMNNHLSQVEAKKNPQKLEQKKTSRSETISGIPCTVHETYFKGMKYSELCMAEADKMGLSSEDAQALMSMQQFMKRLQKVAQDITGSSMPTADIQGIPLHTTLFSPDGAIQMETRLASIVTDAVNSEAISIPVDFSAVPMPGLK